jgi:hypothetical protein
MNNEFATGPVSRRTLLATIAISVVAANLVTGTKTASANETTPEYGRGYGGGY